MLTDTILFRREKKLIQIAQRKISGNANISTSKLSHIIHKIEVGIIVQTLAHRIVANDDVSDNIPVHTKARTSTDIMFELCNIAVVIIQLKNDLETEDVNFFIKFLNHQWENDETTCHI